MKQEIQNTWWVYFSRLNELDRPIPIPLPFSPHPGKELTELVNCSAYA